MNLALDFQVPHVYSLFLVFNCQAISPIQGEEISKSGVCPLPGLLRSWRAARKSFLWLHSGSISVLALLSSRNPFLHRHLLHNRMEGYFLCFISGSNCCSRFSTLRGVRDGETRMEAAACAIVTFFCISQAQPGVPWRSEYESARKIRLA